MNHHFPQLGFPTRSNASLLIPPQLNSAAFTQSTYDPPIILPSSEMAASVAAVERIINYNFRNKRLLEEALTHSSYGDSASYERLEFIGDAVLGLAFSNYLFLAYPNGDPGQLSLLRSANVSTEKLARVAIKHNLYCFLRHNAIGLDEKVEEFSGAVKQEDDKIIYGGSMKAPKVLADIVESLAAAIYIDVNFDLQRLWVIVRGLMEPVVTLEDLQQQPQPVTALFELCLKHGKRVYFTYWKTETKIGMKVIASVFVDGNFVASGSSEHKDIAKLNAAKSALHKLSHSMPDKTVVLGIFEGTDGTFEIEGAKQKLHELCVKKKWPRPTFRIESETGPSHGKKYVCSVQIPTEKGVLCMMGDDKPRVRDAENSASSLMLRSLQDSEYL